MRPDPQPHHVQIVDHNGWTELWAGELISIPAIGDELLITSCAPTTVTHRRWHLGPHGHTITITTDHPPK
jgi:hypothetical protein